MKCINSLLFMAMCFFFLRWVSNELVLAFISRARRVTLHGRQQKIKSLYVFLVDLQEILLWVSVAISEGCGFDSPMSTVYL